jgi:hypothetical protein
MMVMVAAVLVLSSLIFAPVALMVAVDRWDRRRDRAVARQIRLTDAIHAELGAAVAPVVEAPMFHPWRVIFPLRPENTWQVERLIAITNRVLGADHDIVFTRAVATA